MLDILRPSAFVTYVYSSFEPVHMTDNLSEQYKRLADYMGLMSMMTRLICRSREPKSISHSETGSVVDKPIETEKLIGIPSVS